MGIFDQSKDCDYELYRQMYYDTENSFIRGKAHDGGRVFTGGHVTVEATMSDAYLSDMKVKVADIWK